MFDLYSLKSLLHIDTSATIKKCCFNESSRGITICLYCTNDHLVCYFIRTIEDEETNQTKYGSVVTKQLYINPQHGIIQSMCFDDTGSWLLTITEKSLIFLIPISRVIHSENPLLDYDATLIDCCSLKFPTDIVWWKSLDAQIDEIAIVSNDLGEISFINIKTKQEVGGTYVHNAIKQLNVIKDKDSISLWIKCKNGTQWRLILEETRITRSRSSASRKGSTSSANSSSNQSQTEYNYLSCFIVNNDNEAIDTINCWNNKPSKIKIRENDASQVEGEEISNHLHYQWPFIISIKHDNQTSSNDIPHSGLIRVKLILCDDFDYEKTSSNDQQYLLPNPADDPLKLLLIQDRFFLTATSKKCFIVSRDYADVKKSSKINSIIQECAFEDEEMIKIFKLFETDSDGLLNSFVIVTSHNIYRFYPQQTCQQLFFKLVMTPSSLSKFSSIKGQLLSSMLGLNAQILYENVADICLKNKNFIYAFKFYKIAQTAHLKIVTNFISHGYFRETINYIQILFTSKSDKLEEYEKINFANIYVDCMVHLLKNKTEDNQENQENKRYKENLTKNLENFFKENLYYDEQLVLRLLVEHQHFEMAKICANSRLAHGTLLSLLLKFNYLQTKTKDKNTDSKVTNLIESKTFLKMITSKKLTYALILNRNVIDHYIRSIIKLLPSFEMEYLLRVAKIFDPRKPVTQLLLNKVLSQFTLNYFNQDENGEQHSVQKKDILNLFMFVNLMIIRKSGKAESFNEQFISIDNFYNEKQGNEKFMIETNYVAAGQSHAGFIRDGNLFLWGKSSFGCAGSSKQEKVTFQEIISTPICMSLFSKTMAISVKAISCGAHHTLVLTDFGLYSFGLSNYGQLGLGPKVVFSRKPALIDSLMGKDVVTIRCGQYHSLVITSNGELYTFGWGVHGQLGHGNVEDEFVPKKVIALKDQVIVSAATGFGHTIALDAEGNVYSFGNGQFGQLGMGTTDNHSLPQKICSINEPIKLIATKYFHNLALTNDGKLYIWGLNPQTIKIQAQLMRKARVGSQQQNSEQPIEPFIANCDHLTPSLIDLSNVNGTVIKMCTGFLHSILLNSDGEVYSFGKGSVGQLGQGKVKDMKTPNMIVTLNDLKIIDITCGSDFSFAVDNNFNLWGWGLNHECQLGFSSSNSASEHEANKKVFKMNNKKLFTLITGGRNNELIPIRIDVKEEDEVYHSSLSYSININPMKISTDFRQKEINKLVCEESFVYDEMNLISFLVLYHQDLDLNSVLQRCLNFQRFQMAGFICEIENDFDKALEFQLKALFNSKYIESPSKLSYFISKIFSTFLLKVINSIDDGVKVFGCFLKFFHEKNFHFKTLQDILIECYHSQVNDCMFGLIFFSYLNTNQEIQDKFDTHFLLGMIQYTIKIMSDSPDKLLLYQATLEKINFDVEKLSFPTEQMWQNILSSIRSNNNKNGEKSIEFMPIEDEMLIFTCNHYYGLNQFKLKVLPKFEQDISEIDSSVNKSELINLLKSFDDPKKETWESICPKCAIKEFKEKNY